MTSQANTKHKDRLFTFLFGHPDHKDWTLSLYNALNNTAYDDPSMVDFNTIENVLYMGMHNDVSFIIMTEMYVWEHQSSFNPNMPLRELQYVSLLYEKYVEINHLNKFGYVQLRLPVPKLFVFYNGEENEPDCKILELKDSFPEGSDSDIAVKVKMININQGRNEAIMSACKVLTEYAWLIQEIRNGLNQKKALTDAVNDAINSIPKDFITYDVLMGNKTEVFNMLLTEYNEKETMQLFLKQGVSKGQLLKSISIIRKNILKGKSVEDITDVLDDPENLILKIYDLIINNPEFTNEMICDKL